MSLVEGALLGLGAAAAGGFGDLGGAVASRRVGSTRTTGVVVPTTCVMVVLLFLATGATLPTSPAVFAGAMVTGLLGATVYFSVYAALRAGPLTIVIPIIFGYGGLTVLLSILVLQERPAPVSLLAAAVATCGVVLAGVSVEGKSRLRLVSKGVGYAMVALVGIAAIAIVSTLVIREAGWLPSFTVARVTNTIVVGSVLVLLGRRRRQRERERGAADAVDQTSMPLRSAGWPVIVLLLVLAVLDVTGVSLFLAGIQVGPTWLVGLASSFAPLVGIVGGFTLFRERPNRAQWLGVGLVLASAILLIQ